MKKTFFKIFSSLMAGLVLIQSMSVFANQAGMDTSFNTGVPLGFNGHVNTIAIQSDGKILVGGFFTTYQGTAANRIIRLNTDGSRDTSFDIGNGFEGLPSNVNINKIAIQPDGKIIVGGAFATYQGVSANGIIRLNTNGSRDSTFNMGSGFNNTVMSLAIQSDGKIIVGGFFTSYQGVAANRIIRLNSDGTRDSTFDIGSGFFDQSVMSLAIQSDGKIIVGGSFSRYQGVSANCIIRLNSNGSIDSTFNINFTVDASVDSITIQQDGKIIVGGLTSTKFIARLNSNGSRDTSFGIGNVFNQGVMSLAIQSDGKIIVVGYFTAYQGTAANRIIRLNSDWTRDSTFNIGNGFNDEIYTIAIQPDGKIIVGGYFTTYQGVSANNIIRLNADGSRDSTFNIGGGFNDAVLSLAIQSDGKIIVGGYFTTYQGVSANNIIRLNADGSRDTTFNIGSGFNDSPTSIAIQSDGKIIVGGGFTTYQGVSANAIIRLNSDGSRDSTFNSGSGFNEYDVVHAIAIQSDGKIILGGNFTAYQGVSANNIIRLNADGSRDSTFNIGVTLANKIYTIAIQSDGKIIIGGDFVTYEGVGDRILRLNSNGSRDTEFNVGNGFDNNGVSIYTIGIQNDNKIVVGGTFVYKEINANNIVRLNSDGSRDTSFDSGNGFNYDGVHSPGIINTMKVQSDGKIIVGGIFVSYNNTPAGYLTKLYGNANVVNVPNSIDTGTVNDAFLDEGYDIDPGGDLVGDVPMSLIATDGTIPVDLSIRNIDITMRLEADSQILGSGSTNYDGILSVPVPRDIESVNDTAVLSAFKVGAISEPLTIDEGTMTLSVAVPTVEIGQEVNIYNAQDNGVSWHPETTTQVIDKNGVPTVEFTTNNFGDFALTTTEAPDTTPPTASVVYSTTGATNQDVIATLTGESEILININTSTYTFTGNGEFIFTFQDLAGNTGAVTASVNWIDKVAPIGSISYNTITATANDVIATLTLNESGTITNNSGNTTYTFNSNGSFTFEFTDIAGNTGAATATVSRIKPAYAGGAGNPRTVVDTPVVDKVVDVVVTPEKIGNIKDSRYPTETNNAYLWAYQNGITTMPSIQEANIDGKLYRSHLAKMISEYAIKQLDKIPNTGTNCTFSDMKDQSTEMQVYAQAACQLGLMGLKDDGTPNTTFNPTAEVTRAQFGTVLSRLLYGTSNNEVVDGERYTSHLDALNKAGIMTKIDKPTMVELRGNVFLMLMRSVK